MSCEDLLRRADADQIGICSRFVLYEMLGTEVPIVKHKLAFYTSWWSSDAGKSADSQILLCFDLSTPMMEVFYEAFKTCNPRAVPGSIIASTMETVTTKYDAALQAIIAEAERARASDTSILRHAFMTRTTLAVASKTISSLTEAIGKDEQ